MTKRELAAFILKLLGVYAIIQSLPFLQHLIGAVFGMHGYEQSVFFNRLLMQVTTLVPFVLTAGAGILLLTCSRYLASVIVEEDGDVNLSTSLSSEDIQAIGLSIVAVLVFLLAIPRFVYLTVSIWSILTMGGMEEAKAYEIIGAWQNGLSFAIQSGLAIVLFFRAQGLSNLWRRIQVGKYVKIEDV